MQITNRQLVMSIMALNDGMNMPLPIKASFALAKVRKKMQAAFDLYEKARMDLLKGSSKLDDKGEIVRDGNGQAIVSDLAAWNEKFNTLLDQPADLEFQPIPISDLGDVSVPSGILLLLDWLFVDAPEAAT